MKKILVSIVVGALLVGTFSLVSAVGKVSKAGKFENILTAQDVERVTGMSGIMRVPRQPVSTFMNGELNFISRDGSPLLMVQIRPDYVYEDLKADKGYFKSAVSGIGEDAFTSPSFDPQFSVNVRKGQYVMVITTNIDPRNKKRTFLGMDQLLKIANIVDKRL